MADIFTRIWPNLTKFSIVTHTDNVHHVCSYNFKFLDGQVRVKVKVTFKVELDLDLNTDLTLLDLDYPTWSLTQIPCPWPWPVLDFDPDLDSDTLTLTLKLTLSLTFTWPEPGPECRPIFGSRLWPKLCTGLPSRLGSIYRFGCWRGLQLGLWSGLQPVLFKKQIMKHVCLVMLFTARRYASWFLAWVMGASFDLSHTLHTVL